MACVRSSCSPIPGSFYKRESTRCCASCTSIAGCCSESGSCTWLFAAHFQEQGLVLSAVAQIPHHTVATPPHPTLTGELHQQIPSMFGLAGVHAYCDIWLLLRLVVGSVNELELYLMRPSAGTVDKPTGGSSSCLSIFHCRGSPMLSILHT